MCVLCGVCCVECVVWSVLCGVPCVASCMSNTHNKHYTLPPPPHPPTPPRAFAQLQSTPATMQITAEHVPPSQPVDGCPTRTTTTTTTTITTTITATAPLSCPARPNSKGMLYLTTTTKTKKDRGTVSTKQTGRVMQHSLCQHVWRAKTPRGGRTVHGITRYDGCGWVGWCGRLCTCSRLYIHGMMAL